MDRQPLPRRRVDVEVVHWEVTGTDRQPLPRWRVITRVGILLGLVLLAAGFVVRDVRARAFVRTDYVSAGLWIAGAVLAVGGVALNYRMLLELARKRRAAEGLNFALTVALSLGLAGLLCYISTRRFTRMDWTGQRTYSLHSKTRNILRGLDKDVEATIIFAAADDPVRQQAVESTMDMLEEFKAVTKRIQVTEVNWPEDQQKIEQLRQRLPGESIALPSVVFTTAESHRVVPLDRTISATFGQAEFTGEDAFAGALTELTEARKATVYLLTGHGERPREAQEPEPTGREPAGLMSGPEYSISRFVTALQRDNYEVKDLDLATEPAVPEDCGALIIAGPRAPLSDKELKAIKSYLADRNGSALILLDPQAVSGAEGNLNELLSAYGIRAHTEAVGTTNMNMGAVVVQSQEVPILREDVADHPVTADLKNFALVFQYVCPLEVTGGPPGTKPEARALLSGAHSWGETNLRPGSQQAAEYDPGQDIAPPIAVAAVVGPQEVPAPGPMPPAWPQDTSGPKLVVIGSSLSFVNLVVQQQQANLYLLQNSVNWLAGKLHMLGIPPRTLEFNQVSVSGSQVAAARYIFIGILPACIIALGVAVGIMRWR